jgi:hypothetical protein
LLKKYGFYSLTLVLLAAFCLAYAQQEKTPAADALSAKQRSEAKQKEQLTQLMSRIGVDASQSSSPAPTNAYRQLDINLSNSNQTAAVSSIEQQQSVATTAQVLTSQVKQGSLPKHRSFELATDQLLLVTVDEKSRLRWWSTLPDPRVLRAERPGPNGTLTGEVIFQSSLNFSLNIPDDDAAVELRLYHPQWNGQEFNLVLISKLPLTN